MKIRAFITHKLREKYSDCQDRFFLNADNCAFSVSDGMSESFFPQYWAEILAKEYTEGHINSNDDIKPLCNKWHEKVQSRIEELRKTNNLKWRTEAYFKEGKGAGATICGVKFEGAAKWNGHVLGDSCIISIKESRIEQIYTSEERPFDNYPDYFDSNPTHEGRGEIKSFSGKMTGGMKLLLVSDPISEFLSKNRDKDDIIKEILSLKNHEEFSKLVDKLREQGMHNDDTTLVIIEWNGKSAAKIEYEDDLASLIDEENKNKEILNVKEPPFNISIDNKCTGIINESKMQNQVINSEDKTDKKTIINIDLNQDLKECHEDKSENDSTNTVEEENHSSKIEIEKKDLFIDKSYVKIIIQDKMEELIKFFGTSSNKRKGKSNNINKKISTTTLYKKCMTLFDDLINKIDIK